MGDKEGKENVEQILNKLLGGLHEYGPPPGVEDDLTPGPTDTPMYDEHGQAVGYLAADAPEKIALIKEDLRDLVEQWRANVNEEPVGEVSTAASLVYHLVAKQGYRTVTLASMLSVAVAMLAECEGDQ